MADVDDTRVIVLPEGIRVLVDAQDFEAFAGVKLRAQPKKNGGVYIRVSRTQELLHRLIMRPDSGLVVDHINGDTLDNRRANLRICTRAQNLRNAKTRRHSSTGVKGVYVRANKNSPMPWRAKIQADGKIFRLGKFATAEEAHAAYCEAASRLHGEFARFS